MKADAQWNVDNKNTKLTTPKGVAAYAYVDKTEGIDGTDTGKYSLTLVMDPGPETSKFVHKYQALVADAQSKVDKPFNNSPIKENDDGTVSIRFKSKFQPSVLSPSLKPLPPEVPKGSVVRVGTKPFCYTAFGGGVSLYLNVIQMIERGTGGGDSGGFEFEAEDSDTPFETDDDDVDF